MALVVRSVGRPESLGEFVDGEMYIVMYILALFWESGLRRPDETLSGSWIYIRYHSKQTPTLSSIA